VTGKYSGVGLALGLLLAMGCRKEIPAEQSFSEPLPRHPLPAAVPALPPVPTRASVPPPIVLPAADNESCEQVMRHVSELSARQTSRRGKSSKGESTPSAKPTCPPRGLPPVMAECLREAKDMEAVSVCLGGDPGDDDIDEHETVTDDEADEVLPEATLPGALPAPR
jgi:hypothetical protein